MVYSLGLFLNKLIMPANEYLIHGDEEERYTFEDLVADVNRQFEILEGKHYSTRILAEERELLARLKDKYTLVISLAEKIFDIPNPIGNEEGTRLMEEMDLLVDNMTEDAKDLNRKARLNTLVKVEAIDAQFHRYMIIVLCILVVIIVSTGLYGLFLTKGIVIPIRRFVEYTGLVGEGNFDWRLDIKTGDEIGILAESFNGMTQRLKTSQDTIKEHTDKLEEMVGERTRALKDAMEELQELNIKVENAKNDWEATFDSISDIISILDIDFN
ncbi:MAG: HAMP domain-containing protein, partial [Planctomycetota bacterium]